LTNCPQAIEEACATYGRSLGTAFQVIDDVLDYDGNATEMGKNLGDDLREGKATLPLILAMQRGTGEQRLVIQNAIENGATEELDTIIQIVRSTGALAGARAAAAQEAETAIAAISTFPSNEHTTALVQLAANLLGRRH
jgi:octaprenyl-diphosphate synthase